MARSKRFAALIAAVGLAVVPAPAEAAQLDARDNPKVSGPLSHAGGACTTDREKSGGELAVVSRACGDVYGFNPEAEGNKRRNYDVVWLQTNVDPRNGWCVTEARSIIRVPKGYRIEGWAPRKERADTKRRVRTRLVATAGGTAENNGVVKNSWVLVPKVADPTVTRRKLILEWRGETGRKLGFALGVEVSFRANDRPAADPAGRVVSTLKPSC